MRRGDDAATATTGPRSHSSTSLILSASAFACLVPPPPSRATIILSGSPFFTGHGAGGPDGSYPKFFIEWLNHRYPCEANDAGGGGGGRSAGPRGRGRHAAKRTTAQNSQTCFAVWNSIRDAGDSIDLVLMEFNVNDQL